MGNRTRISPRSVKATVDVIRKNANRAVSLPSARSPNAAPGFRIYLVPHHPARYARIDVVEENDPLLPGVLNQRFTDAFHRIPDGNRDDRENPGRAQRREQRADRVYDRRGLLVKIKGGDHQGH